MRELLRVTTPDAPRPGHAWFWFYGRRETMDVKEQIDILVALQKNDTDADQVRKLLSGIAEKQRHLEKELTAAVSAKDAAAADLEGFRKSYRLLESDAKVNLELIRKSKSRLPGVKSNKEYQALLRQVEETEKKNSRIEDEMLAILDRIEAGEQVLEERKQDCLRAENAFETEKLRLVVETEKEEMHLAELAEKRNQIAAAAPPDLMKIFMSTRKMVDGPMIVPVRGNTCEGCNINIPPQMANDLRRFESLNFCPFCNRIIYWEGPRD